MKKRGDHITCLIIYVDDVIITSGDATVIENWRQTYLPSSKWRDLEPSSTSSTLKFSNHLKGLVMPKEVHTWSSHWDKNVGLQTSKFSHGMDYKCLLFSFLQKRLKRQSERPPISRSDSIVTGLTQKKLMITSIPRNDQIYIDWLPPLCCC